MAVAAVIAGEMLRMSKLAAALAAIAFVVGLSACGGESEDDASANTQADAKTKPLSLTLDAPPDPSHAPIYMAQTLGYFDDAGLDVSIQTPSGSSAPLEELAANRTDVEISHQPEAILASQGEEVISIAALIDRPLASMIWLEGSGIGGIGDLRGKTIATTGIPYQAAFLETILAGAGMAPSDVKTIDVGNELLPALEDGRADAILGGSSNVEGVDLDLRGEDPVVTPVNKLGVPTYDELVVVTSSKHLEAGSDSIRRFLRAIERGAAAAFDDPDGAAEAILEANPDLDPEVTEAGVDATLLSLGVPGTTHKTSQNVLKVPYGYMDYFDWAPFIRWMQVNGLIPSFLHTSLAFTNVFLPGETS